MDTAYKNLPQMEGQPFLTDGGMETTLIYHGGYELPLFSSYVLLDDPRGTENLKAYYRSYVDIARRAGIGFILESATWRCSQDWGAKLGHDALRLADFNRRSIALLEQVKAEYAGTAPIVISGNIGPRGDGYRPETIMTADEAEAYHATQIATFAGTSADLVTAMTMTDTGEAIGIVRAASRAGMPVVISFTTETDGRLPSGETLREAIESTDAATGGAAAYFMVNCAHPEHFADALGEGDWRRRIRGIRANASRKSHAELDEATELDIGDIAGLAQDYARLTRLLPELTVFGGCCGTDHRHVHAIADACLALHQPA
jgi:homocysteine S-methyltransferase